ncbi:MAG: c-type cytochrome [Vicinamibacteria bacterium]|jgi:cytochrome c553
MRPIVLSIALAATWVVAAPVLAQSPDSARDIAATCANCHGTNGMSRGTVPSLAGQSKADIAAKMLEFKQNQRPGTIMPQLAKGFTDAQIDAVAAWFASQPSK